MTNNVLKTGWRPAMGWICALALLYHYFLRPVLNGLTQESQFAAISLQDLWPLITGQLGLGSLRTYEKVKGVENG